MEKPLVSVLIPVFNGAQYLEETVHSVFESTNLPVEAILVDDGSTDGSKKRCCSLAAQYHGQVSIVNFNKNKGMTRCLNEGIKVAKGEYIARINQDDLMVKGRLEKQVAFLENHPEHVVVGSYIELFTATNKHFDMVKFPLDDKALKAIWMTLSPFADPAVMYRESAFLKTNGYSQVMWPADDVHMWYMLGKLGKLANIPQVLTRVRWHNKAGSIMSHRLQMKKTWEVHQWAAINIRKPSLGEYAFWAAEYAAGLVFPPRFNWFVYRLMRKLWKKRQFSLSLWQVWEKFSYALAWAK
ncbi:hypothetical protein A2W24_02610 [Microgenomates group bacterium RBG_16_45_19]|nr:MAG: hypothetical protein A2W24_02610 [Microgenomates group bacterium RBG_16_45_19]